MEAIFYGIGVSHPARAAALMLDHKGIKAKRVNLPPGAQVVAMRALGFSAGTVPGLKLDGRRVQGTREISRVLDEVAPQPPLFPANPKLRAAVEEAERWGDEVYQPVPRRVFRWAVATNATLRARIAGSVGLPAPALSGWALWPVTRFYLGFEGGGEQAARRDVAELPEHLDRVDDLIAQGTIDGSELNAADFQIGTTTRVLLNLSELRPLIEGRPAAEHAMRIAPDFGRPTAVGVPAEWIPAPA